jgi:tetratricopeptide (TPR) repeat protein
MKTDIQLTSRAFALALLFSNGLHADTLVLKNGQTVVAKSFQRQGDSFIASAGPNGEAENTTPVTPLAAIAKVEIDPSPVLKSAPGMLASGKAAAALEAVETELKTAEIFEPLPGSCWPDLLVLKAHILLAMGTDAEAGKLAFTMDRIKQPDLVAGAVALRALIAARKGDSGPALLTLESLGKDVTKPSTLAAAAVARGLASLDKKLFEEALKSFLELPVFLPDETALGGIALLGSARAYYALEDFDRAIATLDELVKTRPGTPEIPIAQSLLPEWKRRRTAVQDAKEP